MRKTLFTPKTLATLIAFTVCCYLLVSCSSDEDKHLIPVEEVLQKGLIKLENHIGDWDYGVVYEKEGCVFYKEEDDASPYIQFVSPSNEYDCCVYADGESFLPKSVSFPDETYYFDSDEDNEIVISHTTDDGIEVLDRIGFTFAHEGKSGAPTRDSEKIVTISYTALDDKLKKVIKTLKAILAVGDDYTSDQVKQLEKALDYISDSHYYENVEEIIDELDLCVQASGEELMYCFAEYAAKAQEQIFNHARYSIAVETGSAQLIFGTSAVVNGKICCSSKTFREKGEWGIIYSRDPDNLTLDNNEGCVIADAAGPADFHVNLKGLQPLAQYYYKTFYRFLSKDHGDLFFYYGEKDADYYVESDRHMKDFMTSKGTDVEIVKFTNQYPPVYDATSCTLYPEWKMNVRNAESALDGKIVFKKTGLRSAINEYGFLNVVGGSDTDKFMLDELCGDKWNIDPFVPGISGTNSFKVILTIETPAGKKEVETDWMPFRYSWDSGIQLQ